MNVKELESTNVTPTYKNEANKRNSITENTNQYFRKLLNKFKNLPYLVYKNKQDHIEPTEAYFFLIEHISKTIKIKKHVHLRTKKVKLDANGKNASMRKLNALTEKIKMELL